ncbi:MAG: methionine--tRNA ligase [Acidimicrobiia bacterium]|nr:MAG: methionine--tRNA ligase [Acidimicrobiia bacterium]
MSDHQPTKVLVAVGWPYAQGSMHLGHIAGAYLPADIYARYRRSLGDDVLMVSGSDVHGTPITVKADEMGVSPAEIVDKYHPEFLTHWKDLDISWDLYTTTGTETHKRVVQEFFMQLLENGYLYPHTTEQFFDEQENRFLPDRYVEGTCPHCGYTEARGDQCDNCGKTLDPTDLIDPRSKLSNTKPVLRETEHYYWRLSAFNEPLLEWLNTREGWRPHVINFAKGMVTEGLHDRSFTRDLDWGIPLPVDDLGPGKSIYVWWEALMGYYSAPQEWAELQGTPDAWRDWWEDPAAETYYFVGKDNIPFHAIYWPALILGHGGLNMPTNVPANQFVTFGGAKASKSRGVGRALSWYIERFDADGLRYALAQSLPESNDTDLSDDEIVRRINDELVATWGNLVNRVVAMTGRYFDGVIPEEGDLSEADHTLLDGRQEALDEVGAQLDAIHLRAGIARAMQMAGDANVYLNDMAPWKTAKTDMKRTATTLWAAHQLIVAVAVALFPYLPETSRRVLVAHGIVVPDTGPTWAVPDVAAGTTLEELGPLFSKVELEPED